MAGLICVYVMSGGTHPSEAATGVGDDSVTDNVARDLARTMLQDIANARPSAEILLRYANQYFIEFIEASCPSSQ